MPKVAEEMNGLAIKRRAESGKVGPVAVGGVPGLELHVKGKTSANWILRIRVNGKRVKAGLGGYPAVTLAEAREAARQLRAKAAENLDPIQVRDAERKANREKAASRKQFWDVADQVWREESKHFVNGKHIKQWIGEIKNIVDTAWDGLYIDQIDEVAVADVLKPGWMDKCETHRRVRKRLELIFQRAIFNKWYPSAANPARWLGNLDQTLKGRKDQKPAGHFRAEPWENCPAFVKRLQAITSKKERITARALEFLILSGGRSGPVRMAEWSEFDFEAKLWRVPPAHMKGKKHRKVAHTVPLTPRMLEILSELDWTSEVVFPPRPFKNPKPLPPGEVRTLSDSTMSGMCRDLGIHGTPHGFRSSFTDWSLEMGYSEELSERALAHAEKNKVRAAYARTEMLNQRIAMMNRWDAFLTGRNGAAQYTDQHIAA